MATLQQELIGLNRDARIPEALKQMEIESDQHTLKVVELRRDISEEKAKVSAQSSLIGTLEDYFYDALREAGFPSRGRRHSVH